VPKKILIEATHPEETRVAIVEDSKLLDFDHEHTDKKTIKGNLYLAKVIRVEPSLQAAFVDYGGNRHGFLAFDEIHPDYFRIPVEDRKLFEELRKEEFKKQQDLDLVDEESSDEPADTIADADDGNSDDSEDNNSEEEKPETSGVKRPRSVREFIRRYKIQEVIKSRQIVLVQAVKEERNNKGAAMTTYISLAGRYCVLMPNTNATGGVSRRINKITDRKRLKKILTSFEVPEGMSLIIRTAGMDRNKTELKRDYKYLLSLWSDIRDLTMKAVAPSLIHTEADLIQRTLRDMYTRDVDEVLIEGNEAYKDAKALMKKVLPSHAKRVQKYADESMPMFFKYGIEKQINQIFYSQVSLKSGGYLIIQQTEALVSVDVNSGRATRERHIQSTAYNTNMEAAAEVCRQIRLRDLAGLIVVDFIDMPDMKHNQAVERVVREAFNDDRARVQIGRISQFGLLELSRQRIRPSLNERSGIQCQSCLGTGYVRSPESMGLQLLRLIEEEAVLNKRDEICVKLPKEVGFYILNHKRSYLTQIEQKTGAKILLEPSETIGNGFEILGVEGEVVFSTSEESQDSISAKKASQEGKESKRVENNNQRDGNRKKRDRGPRKEQNLPKGENKSSQAIESTPVDEQGGEAPKADTQRDGTAKKRRRPKRNRNSGNRDQDDSVGNREQKPKSPKKPKGEGSNSRDEEPSIQPENKTELGIFDERPKKGNQKSRGSKKGWWQKLLETDN
tara:strand:- start:9862 stop:12057 length:2196 start_codon:yes stop_codon:yes gene_type:complete